MSGRHYVSPVVRRHRRRPPGRALILTTVLSAVLLGVVWSQLTGIGVISAVAKASVPTSNAQPHIADFANGLKGQVNKPLAQAPAPFSYGANMDGCDHNYGSRGECVPYNFPPQVAKNPTAKCAYLLKQHFKALEIVGTDRQGLAPVNGPKSPEGHAYACPSVLATS